MIDSDSESPNPFKGKAQHGAPEGKAIDTLEVHRALRLLVDFTEEMEVRSIRKTESVVLRGWEVERMVQSVAGMANAAAVYLCLNPVKLGAPCSRSARDEDVTRRRWLFLDIDSIRPDAKENCATHEEKEVAQKEKDAIREYLHLAGWPEPVEVDSGNGFYLLYRIDLPNDEDSRLLLRSFLHALSGRFTDVKIDRAVHNASRIARLPGTWNKKGRNSPQRPHRMCRLLSVPETLYTVSTAQILAIAGEQSKHETNGHAGVGGDSNPFKGKSSTNRLERYCQSLLTQEALNVALAVRGHQGGHGANNTLNEAAFAVGTVLGWGVLDESEARGILQQAAERAGLDEGEIGPTIDSGFRAGKLKPRALPDWAKSEQKKQQGQKTKTEPEQADSPGWQVLYDGEIIAEGQPEEVCEQFSSGDEEERFSSKVHTIELCTIGNILRTEYPEPKWVIEGIMSEGLNILAGAPKQGKSMLSLNLALTVAGGGKALGDNRVEPRDVLYLSLEDQFRRVKYRALKMLKVIEPDLSCAVGKHLTIATEWPRQDQGGLSLLDAWVKRAANPGLLIIDVWNRFCPTYTLSSAYSQDAEYLSRIKRFGERRGFDVLVVHHTRKPGMKEPDDFVYEISGTMGLSGTADGILVLMRSRQDKQAALHVTGRDVAEQELVLEFDEKTLTWKYLGNRSDYVEGHVQSAVFAFLKTNRPDAFFVKQIADAIEEKVDSVKKACQRLAERKDVRKVGYAFAYPGSLAEGNPAGDE